MKRNHTIETFTRRVIRRCRLHLLDNLSDEIVASVPVDDVCKALQQAHVEALAALAKRARAKQFITENYADSELRISTLAEHMGMAESTCSKWFIQSFAETLNVHVTKLRVEAAQGFLRHERMVISDVWKAVGFQNSSHFNVQFRKMVGCSPTEYRKRYKEE
jgi:AraC-like DNA-binding protein